MENKVQIFDNPEFGEVRVVMIDGKPHFVAADVCRILELGNITEALRRLDEDELTSVKLNSGGQMREMKLVNEPGLYRLIFASRKPEAKKLLWSVKKWSLRAILLRRCNFSGNLRPHWAKTILREKSLLKLLSIY